VAPKFCAASLTICSMGGEDCCLRSCGAERSWRLFTAIWTRLFFWPSLPVHSCQRSCPLMPTREPLSSIGASTSACLPYTTAST
jgi:hypothetical protein